MDPQLVVAHPALSTATFLEHPPTNYQKSRSKVLISLPIMNGRFPIRPNRRRRTFLIPTWRQFVSRFTPRLVIMTAPHPCNILVAPPGNGPTIWKRVSVVPPFTVPNRLTVERKRLQAFLKFITSKLVLGLFLIASGGNELVTPLIPLVCNPATRKRPLGLAETVLALPSPLNFLTWRTKFGAFGAV